MALDLKELERKLDECLQKETPESLREWLNKKRIEEAEADRLSGQFSSFSNDQIEIIKKQVRGWDLTYSVLRAIEELSELTVALTHLWRKHGDRQHEVLVEMADVRIALKHLEIVFGNCQDFIDKKVGKES